MRRAWISGLVMLWLLTTGSSCETTGQANSLTIQSADGGVVIMLVLVAGYCLLDTERCGGGEPTPLQNVQATFENGVRRYRDGDPTGLQWVCPRLRRPWFSETTICPRVALCSAPRPEASGL